jgi:hypothetical protein
VHGELGQWNSHHEAKLAKNLRATTFRRKFVTGRS